MSYLILILPSLVLALISTYKWNKLGFSLVSPAAFCLLLWSLVWLIHSVNIFEYYELSVETQVYSFVAVVAMYIGEELGRRSMPKDANKIVHVDKLSFYLLVNSYVALFFSILCFVSVYIIFGNPLDDGVGRAIKEARGSDGVGMLRSSPLYVIVQYVNISRAFLYLSFFSIIPLWLYNRRTAKKVGLITVLAALTSDVSWGSRTLILDLLILTYVWMALCLFKGGASKKRKKSGVWVLSLLTVFLLFIGAQKITESTRQQKDMEVQGIPIPYALGQLLIYYTASLVSFDQTLDNNKENTLGLMSFGGVLNILHLFRVYRNENLKVYEIMFDWEVENPYYRDGDYRSRANTYTWLRYIYSDFGELGFVVLPLVLGVVSGRAAKRISVSAKKDYFDYVKLFLCFYVVARSPIIMPFRTDYVVLGLIMALVLSVIATSKKRK